jgi:hypothetical protein
MKKIHYFSVFALTVFSAGILSMAYTITSFNLPSYQNVLADSRQADAVPSEAKVEPYLEHGGSEQAKVAQASLNQQAQTTTSSQPGTNPTPTPGPSPAPTPTPTPNPTPNPNPNPQPCNPQVSVCTPVPLPTGILGKMTVMPKRIVCIVFGKCDPQPYQGTVTIQSKSGEYVTKVTADTEGNFKVLLPAGTYNVYSTKSSSLDQSPQATEQTVTVADQTLVNLEVRFK